MNDKWLFSVLSLFWVLQSNWQCISHEPLQYRAASHPGKGHKVIFKLLGIHLSAVHLEIIHKHKKLKTVANILRNCHLHYMVRQCNPQRNYKIKTEEPFTRI